VDLGRRVWDSAFGELDLRRWIWRSVFRVADVRRRIWRGRFGEVDSGELHLEEWICGGRFGKAGLERLIWGGGFGEVGSTLVPLSACWQGLLLECRKEARDGSSGDMQGGLFGQLGVGA